MLSRFFLLLFCLSLGLSFNALALDVTERQALKQELLTEILQSDALKKYVINEIKRYETEKNQLKKQQKTNAKNKIKSSAEQIIRAVSPKIDHIYGDLNAPISIVEFSDFECAYCRKIHPVLKRLVNESKGQINWVFRHYPLSFHKPNAQIEAEAAECIANLTNNQGFWTFIDALFFQPRRGQANRDLLINRAAAKVNISPEALNECKKNGQFAEKVAKDEAEALAIGLRGTPANVIIHNKSHTIRIRQGAASLRTLRSDIEKLLGAVKK